MGQHFCEDDKFKVIDYIENGTVSVALLKDTIHFRVTDEVEHAGQYSTAELRKLLTNLPPKNTHIRLCAGSKKFKAPVHRLWPLLQ